MSGSRGYRPHALLTVRAFFLTDRVGHTIASLFGVTKVIWWWLRGKLARLAGDRTGAGSGDH